MPKPRLFTPLPYPSIVLSAACLHDDDLLIARQSALTILLHLRHQQSHPDLEDHPCTRMWHGYSDQLTHYGLIMCLEWRSRGHEDRLMDTFAALQSNLFPTLPWWWYLPAIARSHRSSLWGRRPGHYAAWWPRDPSPTPIFWPVGPKLTPVPF